VSIEIGLIQFHSCMLFPNFLEGDVAVSLDGGSRFYERDSVKIAFPEILITCLLVFGLKSLLRS
jgi:hypothetical protein